MARKPKQKPQKKEKKEGKSIQELYEKLEKLEKIAQSRELEGDPIGLEEKEQESQMFTIPRDFKDITGEFDGLLTKTRFDDNADVESTIEPFIARQYMILERTRYGGSHIFLSIEDIINKKIDLEEYRGFEIIEEPIKINGCECIEILIDIAALRTRVILKGRFASLGGKARIEKIHDSASKNLGQGYIEQHTPPPPLYAPGYGAPKNKLSKSEVAEALLLEEEK